MLPQLYEMDNYEECLRNHSQYCKVQGVLNIPLNNIKLAKQLQELVLDHSKINRSILYRAMCLPITEMKNNSIKNKLSELLNEKIKSLNVTSSVDSFYCSNGKMPLTTFDRMTLVLILIYLVIILFATYKSNFAETGFLTGFRSILKHFSLVKSWKNRTIPIKNKDYKNLLSMQGLRVFTMTYIICGHVLTYYLLIYIRNPDSLEELHSSISEPLKYGLMYMVLNFFLISSWLSTLQAYNIIEKYGIFTIHHVGIIILNRYFRLLLALLISFIMKSNLFRLIDGPVNFDMHIIFQEACRKNWFYNVLYINNFINTRNICNTISWYLAADFQMYLIGTFIIFITFKFKLNDLKTYSMVLLICCLLHGANLYYRNVLLFRPTVRNLEHRNFLWLKDIVNSYLSTVTIASSSCIGMILGAIYFKNKNKINKHKQILSIVWFILFFGLTTLSFLISTREYGRLESAILGAIIKPMYCLGLGIGLLGMSFNMGGIVKRIFENGYFVFLSNFSFSIYICHWIVIMQIHGHALPDINYFTIIKDLCLVYSISVGVGIAVTLAVEEPFLSLQKQILPQIKKYDKVD